MGGNYMKANMEFLRSVKLNDGSSFRNRYGEYCVKGAVFECLGLNEDDGMLLDADPLEKELRNINPEFMWRLDNLEMKLMMVGLFIEDSNNIKEELIALVEEYFPDEQEEGCESMVRMAHTNGIPGEELPKQVALVGNS